MCCDFKEDTVASVLETKEVYATLKVKLLCKSNGVLTYDSINKMGNGSSNYKVYVFYFS